MAPSKHYKEIRSDNETKTRSPSIQRKGLIIDVSGKNTN